MSAMSAPGPASYLTGPTVGLRSLAPSDLAHAHLWYERDVPLDAAAFEQEMRKAERIPWGGNPVIRLIMVHCQDGAIIGGVVVTRSHNRTSRLAVVCHSVIADRRTLLREVLPMVVSWLVNEVGVMTVVLETPDDDPVMIGAAEEAGMAIAVRRREHLLRPSGRVDLLLMERVNPDWGRHAG